jgi:hypothetical protein
MRGKAAERTIAPFARSANTLLAGAFGKDLRSAPKAFLAQ